MQQSDLAFINDIRAASELRTPRTSSALLVSVIALMAAGVIWAHFAELDEVKRGNGRVVPSRQIQVLQSLEGGIVREILVHEGTIVKEGEVLMKIDDTRFASELGEVRARRGGKCCACRTPRSRSAGPYPRNSPMNWSADSLASGRHRNATFSKRGTSKLINDIDVLMTQEIRFRGDAASFSNGRSS